MTVDITDVSSPAPPFSFDAVSGTIIAGPWDIQALAVYIAGMQAGQVYLAGASHAGCYIAGASSSGVDV